MSTPEGKVKSRTDAVLKKYDCYYHKPVLNGMGKPTLDYIGCHDVVITPEMVGKTVGLFFAIETKAGNKQPTPRQEITIAEMRKAGAKVFVVNEETGTDELVSWLEVSNERHGLDNT